MKWGPGENLGSQPPSPSQALSDLLREQPATTPCPPPARSACGPAARAPRPVTARHSSRCACQRGHPGVQQEGVRCQETRPSTPRPPSASCHGHPARLLGSTEPPFCTRTLTLGSVASESFVPCTPLRLQRPLRGLPPPRAPSDVDCWRPCPGGLGARQGGEAHRCQGGPGRSWSRFCDLGWDTRPLWASVSSSIKCGPQLRRGGQQ